MAIRTFVGDEMDRIPSRYTIDGMLPAILNTVVVGPIMLSIAYLLELGALLILISAGSAFSVYNVLLNEGIGGSVGGLFTDLVFLFVVTLIPVGLAVVFTVLVPRTFTYFFTFYHIAVKNRNVYVASKAVWKARVSNLPAFLIILGIYIPVYLFKEGMYALLGESSLVLRIVISVFTAVAVVVILASLAQVFKDAYKP
ncbi:MAG: hypothetical protein SXQ77_06750 [Halobacteria archaeon]|nr:hypothetical protein [Halobacteria archaeon]